MSAVLVAGLDRCHAAFSPTGVVVGQGGLVLASRQRVTDAGNFTAAGRPRPRSELGIAGVRDEVLARSGIACARVSTETEVLPDEGFAVALVRWQINVLRHVLHSAVEHLRSRTSDGISLLHRQLVQGTVADTEVSLRQAESVLALPVPPVSLWLVHRRLVDTGRLVLRLFGASGFLVTGPGADVYVTELAGSVYLHPGRTADRG